MCRICGGQFIFGGQFKGRLTTRECLGLKKVDTFRKGKTCQKWTKTILLERATGSFVQNGGGGERALPDERAEAVRQLLEKEQTVEQIVSRFNLSSVQVVYGWIGRYIEESLLSDTSQKPEVDSKELTLSEALKEIKRLKKALDLEKMRSAGYSHMIELAEQQFNIPIRKKSGTKQ